MKRTENIFESSFKDKDPAKQGKEKAIKYRKVVTLPKPQQLKGAILVSHNTTIRTTSKTGELHITKEFPRGRAQTPPPPPSRGLAEYEKNNLYVQIEAKRQQIEMRNNHIRELLATKKAIEEKYAFNIGKNEEHFAKIDKLWEDIQVKQTDIVNMVNKEIKPQFDDLRVRQAKLQKEYNAKVEKVREIKRIIAKKEAEKRENVEHNEKKLMEKNICIEKISSLRTKIGTYDGHMKDQSMNIQMIKENKGELLKREEHLYEESKPLYSEIKDYIFKIHHLHSKMFFVIVGRNFPPNGLETYEGNIRHSGVGGKETYISPMFKCNMRNGAVYIGNSHWLALDSHLILSNQANWCTGFEYPKFFNEMTKHMQKWLIGSPLACISQQTPAKGLKAVVFPNATQMLEREGNLQQNKLLFTCLAINNDFSQLSQIIAYTLRSILGALPQSIIGLTELHISPEMRIIGKDVGQEGLKEAETYIGIVKEMERLKIKIVNLKLSVWVDDPVTYQKYSFLVFVDIINYDTANEVLMRTNDIVNSRAVPLPVEDDITNEWVKKIMGYKPIGYLFLDLEYSKLLNLHEEEMEKQRDHFMKVIMGVKKLTTFIISTRNDLELPK